MSEKNNSSFVLGVVVGAALVYLFTTENGKRIKKELIKEGSKLFDSIGDTIEEFKSDNPDFEKVGEKLLETKEELSQSIDEIKGESEEILREVPQQIEQIQKKGRHFFFKKNHPRSES